MAEVVSTGATLTFINDGDGVTIDPQTGNVTVESGAARDSIEVKVSLGSVETSDLHEFLIKITDLQASDTTQTVFESVDALASMSHLYYVELEWSLESEASLTFARLVPASNSRAHGDWTKARGDGLYRTLLRWSGDELDYSLNRRMSFGARVAKTGADWTGIRIDAYKTSDGASKLHAREYVGSKGNTTQLATTDVAWEYGAWCWLDVQVVGDVVKARLYPEDSTAPDWQIVVKTTQLANGAFGPGGFPALDQSPVIDIREMSYQPAI